VQQSECCNIAGNAARGIEAIDMRNLKYGLIILIGFLAKGCDDGGTLQPVAAQEIHATSQK
jgi:hypothetical protein